ncbi:hypothetical protein DSECCO2_296480 [anaerobic digester metagenome]
MIRLFRRDDNFRVIGFIAVFHGRVFHHNIVGAKGQGLPVGHLIAVVVLHRVFRLDLRILSLSLQRVDFDRSGLTIGLAECEGRFDFLNFCGQLRFLRLRRDIHSGRDSCRVDGVAAIGQCLGQIYRRTVFINCRKLDVRDIQSVFADGLRLDESADALSQGHIGNGRITGTNFHRCRFRRQSPSSQEVLERNGVRLVRQIHHIPAGHVGIPGQWIFHALGVGCHKLEDFRIGAVLNGQGNDQFTGGNVRLCEHKLHNGCRLGFRQGHRVLGLIRDITLLDFRRFHRVGTVRQRGQTGLNFAFFIAHHWFEGRGQRTVFGGCPDGNHSLVNGNQGIGGVGFEFIVSQVCHGNHDIRQVDARRDHITAVD